MSYRRRSSSRGREETRVYVGNLPPDIREKDIKDLFNRFGKINNIDLKNQKGPPFAFLEFDDPLDAEDAVKERDGYDLDAYVLRVEFPKSGRSRDYDDRRSRDRDRGYSSRSYGDRGGGYGGGYSGGFGRPRGARSNYKVIVSGLPKTGSWQDLKDHMREAGDVLYTDVMRDGTGVCEFKHQSDMEWAIKELNDSRFESHEGEKSYIRVKKAGGYSRSRSRSRDRSRSPYRR